MVSVDLVAMHYSVSDRSEMRDDLMSVKIEINPRVRTATFLATEDATIELSRLFEVSYRECQMEQIFHNVVIMQPPASTDKEGAVTWEESNA